MKEFIIVCLFLFSISAISFGQNYLEAGNTCFNAGNYQCAKENFEKELKKKYTQVTEVKLRRSNNCLKILTQANAFFLQRNFTDAKTAYQEVLDLNPNDNYAKQQIEKCNQYLRPEPTTLSLSKTNLSFPSLGGKGTINITTDRGSYNVEVLPSWCTVEKYSNYFEIKCTSNPANSARRDYFRVTSGDKSIQVYVSQSGKQETNSVNTPTTLSVSNESIYFERQGGNSNSIQVYSNAKSYIVSMVPSWCTIKYYIGYFVVICEPNNSKARSSWFYVLAGDKQVKISVSQNGTSQNNSKTTNYRNPKRTNLYLGAGALKPLVFMSDGRTPTNMNVGYGFTLGIVKTLGVYAKLNTNFSDIKSAYSYSNFPTEYYTLASTTDVYTFSRFGYVGGLMLQLKPFIFYVGAGKGHFYHYKEVNAYKYLDDSYYDKLNIVTQSFSGLETDAGLIINLNNLGLSFGVSSFSFNYYEVNAGIGIRF